MNDMQRVTVEFNRWLAQASAGNMPTVLNADGSARPSEMHWGTSTANVADMPTMVGSIHTIPDLLRQSLAVLSAKFRQREGRDLCCNFITVRVFTHNTRLQDHDCLAGPFKSEQTIWFSHTGRAKFECTRDSPALKSDLEVNGTINKPKSFSARTASRFRRFREDWLSIDQVNDRSNGIVMGCPTQSRPETVKTGDYLVGSMCEWKQLGHMFNISADKYGVGPKNLPVCIQVVFRQLVPDLEESAMIRSSDGNGVR